MLIKLIIEFELRGPEHLNGACTRTTGYFHDITKISLENLRVDYII